MFDRKERVISPALWDALTCFILLNFFGRKERVISVALWDALACSGCMIAKKE